nr:non-specific lipid-transfer protein 1-like [Ipomoea batatas]
MADLSRKSSASPVLVLLFVVVTLAPRGESAMTCDTVYNDLKPCLSYILFGGNVSADCCGGLKTLVSGAQTAADRQSACSCLKSAASRAGASQISRAAEIPEKCGVDFPYKVDPNVDCSKQNYNPQYLHCKIFEGQIRDSQLNGSLKKPKPHNLGPSRGGAGPCTPRRRSGGHLRHGVQRPERVPQLRYVRRKCAGGMKTLVAAAKTTADRQSACSCLKSIASNANASQLSRAAGLPAKCGVNIPFKIGPNVDCSKVKFGF